jgi:hypothetical protein
MDCPRAPSTCIAHGRSISERYRDQALLRTELPLESPMPTPNLDTMTVRQLIDIIAFLDSKYELLVEDYQ